MVNSVAETSQEVRNGIVSDNGQVYMAGLPLEGALSVQWGKKGFSAVSCKLSIFGC
ncbi:hypothetical protein LNP20_21020 [Klebsiella pneumoniae subsp. pneumoniae]|nr:hypothetical protein [Klebsiella pneumoniae subsp. pneumoniae]